MLYDYSPHPPHPTPPHYYSFSATKHSFIDISHCLHNLLEGPTFTFLAQVLDTTCHRLPIGQEEYELISIFPARLQQNDSFASQSPLTKIIQWKIRKIF